jgi:hypothetical protein
MELKIGLVDNSQNSDSPLTGWELVLSQIGIPYEKLRENFSEFNQKYPVCILSDSIEQGQLESAKDYIRKGGNVICSSKLLTKLMDVEIVLCSAQHIMPDDESPFSDSDLIDLSRKIEIPTGCQHLKTNRGIYSLYKTKVGDGNIIAFPFDVNVLMLDTRSRKKSFYSQRGRLPYENVSQVSKGALRRLALNSLEYLFHQANLPFVHLWFYPGTSKSIFCFRVDTDGGEQKQVEDLYKLSLKNKIPFTWFVDVKSHLGWINYFSGMADHEIGIHCYEHEVFNSYADNYKNIHHASQKLKEIGISPVGYAAPFGKWNSGLAQAVRDHNFIYSSEFSYDYDNLPSNTVLFDFPISVLQIPIHPICIGNMRRQGFSDEEMMQYFRMQVDKKLSINEPLVFYHHPTHDHLEVIENLLNYVKDKNIITMKMRDYADWWNKRDLIKLEMTLENDILTVESENYFDDVFIRITTRDNKETLIKPQHFIDLSKITYRNKNKALSPPKDIARSRKFNKWMLINKIEDHFHR